jgi:hypothetical protein
LDSTGDARGSGEGEEAVRLPLSVLVLMGCVLPLRCCHRLDPERGFRSMVTSLSPEEGKASKGGGSGEERGGRESGAVLLSMLSVKSKVSYL